MTAVETVAQQLAARLGDAVERDVPSARVTTYRCGGAFAVAVHARDDAALVEVGRVVRAHADVPVLVVGRGSNLLVADAGFAGVALLLEGGFDALEIDDRTARVHAGGAVALPVLARRCAAAGVGGLEFFVGIPGSVGGAVCMNAGGHGAETADVLVTARVVDLDRGCVREWVRDELALGYRTSAIGERMVVSSATFAGRREPVALLEERIDEIVRWRREHQPGGQNAGSVFTNPPGDAAGRLIDECGLKGLRIGGASVSEKHANFFVADTGARADDVFALVREVRRRVYERTGVLLRPEVQLVGFTSIDEEAV